MLFYIFFVIVLYALSVFFPKNYILSAIIFFLLFCMYALGENADSENYRISYQYFGDIDHSKEVGYNWLMDIGHLLNFSYAEFRIATSIISLTLLYFAVRLLTPYVNIVFTSYLFFSSMLDAVQVRTAFGISFIIIALIFLINSKDQKKNYILSTLFVVIASLIHSSYWIFLLVVAIWPFFKNRKYRKFILIGVGILYLMTPILVDNIFVVYSNLIIRESTVEKYMTGNYANINGVIFNFIEYIVYICPVVLYEFFIKRDITRLAPSNKIESALIANILNINLIFSIVLIPQYIAVNFSRIFRVLVLINYCYMTYFIYTSKNKIRFLQASFLLLYALLLFCFWIIKSPGAVGLVIYPFLEFNPVLKEIFSY